MSHYQGADPRLRRLLLPRPQPAHGVPQGGPPGDPVRRAPRVGEDLQRRQRRARRPTPRRKAKFDEGVAAALAIKPAERDGTATEEQLDTWAFLDAVAFANVRGARRPRRGRGRRHRRRRRSRGRCSSGSTPIGVPLTEIYGMCETTRSDDVVARAQPARHGRSGDPRHARCAIADDGEVICRGGNVFQGYLNQPDKTAETLDRRLAAHRRHRRARRRRLPARSSTARRS